MIAKLEMRTGGPGDVLDTAAFDRGVDLDDLDQPSVQAAIEEIALAAFEVAHAFLDRSVAKEGGDHAGN